MSGGGPGAPINSFVMFTAVDETPAIVVRGGVFIQLGTAPLDEVVRGEGAATWVDGMLDDAIVEVSMVGERIGRRRCVAHQRPDARDFHRDLLLAAGAGGPPTTLSSSRRP